MTLGLTSSGAIKIKTDGGLRAVNCACCVPLDCGCMVVSNDLKSVIESATQVSVNGSPSQPWDGIFAMFEDFVGDPPVYLLWFVTYVNGYICIEADTGAGTVKLAPEPFTAEECWSFATPVINFDGSINGQTIRVAQLFEESPLTLTVVFS